MDTGAGNETCVFGFIHIETFEKQFTISFQKQSF